MLSEIRLLPGGERAELLLDVGDVRALGETRADVLRQQVETDGGSGYDHRCDHDKPRFASHGCNHKVVALACQ
jgi:hypothetical protein